jgi:peptidyl-tRNA hydrolase
MIMRHFRKVVPRLVVFLFTIKSFINETGRLMGHIYRGFQECASTVVVFADPLSPILSTLTAMNTPDNRKD